MISSSFLREGHPPPSSRTRLYERAPLFGGTTVTKEEPCPKEAPYVRRQVSGVRCPQSNHLLHAPRPQRPRLPGGDLSNRRRCLPSLDRLDPGTPSRHDRGRLARRVALRPARSSRPSLPRLQPQKEQAALLRLEVRSHRLPQALGASVPGRA